MPIPKIKRNKVAASSTHGGNDEDVEILEGDQDLMNHMSADMLIDPEDFTAGSTHTSVTAKRKLKAGESTNVGTLDNDDDPTDGYIENASIEDEDELDEETEVDDAEDELVNNNAPSTISASEEEDDWDPAPEDDDDEAEEDEPEEDDIEAPEVDESEAEEEEEDEPEEVSSGDDSVPLVDADEVEDTDVDNVAFASAGTRLLVIRASRIIATMTGKRATAMGRHDVYLSDQFQAVTASELKSKGLRGGLKAMGFALTTVSLAKASVVKAQVAKEVTKATAAVRKVVASKEAAMEQSLAIAAVGINRRFFNDVSNPLKDALQSELTRAGVQNPGRILQRAFAEHGPAFAKNILAVASKVAAMPQETRDSYVEALDMTSAEDDGMPEVDDEDMVPVGVEADEYNEEFDDGYEPSSVDSALATAGVRRKAVTASGNYSVTANEILNGSKPLFSL